MSFAPGEQIMREGDVGDSFYAISSGQVDIVKDERLVTTIGRGSYFGEVALLMEVPRTATVTARTPVRAFRLDREGFDHLVGDAFRRGTLDSRTRSPKSAPTEGRRGADGLLALQAKRGRGLSLLWPRDLRGPRRDAPLYPRALPHR